MSELLRIKTHHREEELVKNSPPQYYPNLHQTIKCTRLLQSVFDKILKNKNRTLFDELICDIIIKHLEHYSTIKQTSELLLNTPSFKPHMRYIEANNLKVNDKVDHQRPNGLFLYSTIIEKNEKKLKIHSDGYSKIGNDIWCDYSKELTRFAKAGTISKRPSYRFPHLRKYHIDVNPLRNISDRYPSGWKHGIINKFYKKSGQVQVYYDDKLYWTHLDNELEIRKSTQILKILNALYTYNVMLVDKNIELFCNIFYRSLLFTSYSISYYNQLTTKLIQINNKFDAPEISNKYCSSLFTSMPTCIFGHIMSFLTILEVITTTRISYMFFNVAHQNNSITELDCNFFYQLEKHYSLSYNIIPKEFFKRFCHVSSMCFDTDGFQSFDDNLKFIKMFTHLIKLKIQCHEYNMSHLNAVLTLPKLLNNVQCLDISSIAINLSFFKYIYKFNQLNHLILTSCCADFTNNMNIWDNYDKYQLYLSKITKLELICGSDDFISLTLIRMLLTPNLKYLRIDSISVYSFSDDFTYISPSSIQLVNFHDLQLKECDLSFSENNDVDCLEKLTIRSWLDNCTQFDITNKCMLHNKDNNFLSEIIKNNLKYLKEINFISSNLNEDLYMYQISDIKHWSPLLAIYEMCILYPKWCKNVFKRFTFMLEGNICCEVASSGYISDDHDEFMKWLHFIRNITNKLELIFKKNNVNFLIEMTIQCDKHHTEMEESNCLLFKCKEYSNVLWNWRPQIQCGKYKTTVSLTNKLKTDQTLITKYFNIQRMI